MERRWVWLALVCCAMWVGPLACQDAGGDDDTGDDDTGDDDTGDDDATDDDTGDDDTGDDDTGDDDDSASPLDVCMEGSDLDFTCASWTMETAVAGETAPCIAAASPTAEGFFTFWLGDTEPDGSVVLLEVRLQDAGWDSTNDSDRWVITLDPPLLLGADQALPATLTGSAVIDVFTWAAPYAFLEGHLDAIQIDIGGTVTLEDLVIGTTLDATISGGGGGEFLVLDGDGEWAWIEDSTAEATGCVHGQATLHPLELGDP